MCVCVFLFFFYFFIFHFIDRKTAMGNLFINRTGRNSNKNNAIGRGLSFLVFVSQMSQKQTSSVASGGKGAEYPPTTKNLPKRGKNLGKSGKNQEKRWKIRKKRKNQEERQKSGRFFHFAPPDREGWLCYWIRHKYLVYHININDVFSIHVQVEKSFRCLFFWYLHFPFPLEGFLNTHIIKKKKLCANLVAEMQCVQATGNIPVFCLALFSKFEWLMQHKYV